MLFKAELNNKEDVLRWYEARDNSCYFICTGVKLDAKQIFSKYTGEDGTIGTDKLRTSLEFIANNVSNSNTYTLVSFPYEESADNIKIKDIEGEMIRFQFNIAGYSQSLGAISTPSISEGSSNDYAKALLQMMQKQNEAMFNKFQELEMKLNEKLNEEEDEEDEDDEEPQPLTGKERLMGALAGIVEKPEFTETMFGLVGMAINKFLSPKETKENGSGEHYSDTDGSN